MHGEPFVENGFLMFFARETVHCLYRCNQIYLDLSQYKEEQLWQG